MKITDTMYIYGSLLAQVHKIQLTIELHIKQHHTYAIYMPDN